MGICPEYDCNITKKSLSLQAIGTKYECCSIHLLSDNNINQYNSSNERKKNTARIVHGGRFGCHVGAEEF